MSARVPRGRLQLILLVSAVLAGCANAGSEEGSSGPAGLTLFRSTILPYSVQLPHGWTALSSSGDEDIYESSDLRRTLRVGTARPEPGQTVEDRVRFNRETEFARCETDPSLDRGVTLGGERGILWAFTCGGMSGMAANTIREGVGYRLTLRAYTSDVEDLEALMASIVESFTFLD